jgi:hypothetical protein
MFRSSLGEIGLGAGSCSEERGEQCAYGMTGRMVPIATIVPPARRDRVTRS